MANLVINNENIAKVIELLSENGIPYTISSENVVKATVKSEPKKATGKKFAVHLVKDGKLYFIRRGENDKCKNGGWTPAEKNCIKAAIKKAIGTKGTEVARSFEKSNGKVVNYVERGFAKKAEAEAVMKLVQTSFTADEIAEYEWNR